MNLSKNIFHHQGNKHRDILFGLDELTSEKNQKLIRTLEVDLTAAFIKTICKSKLAASVICELSKIEFEFNNAKFEFEEYVKGSKGRFNKKYMLFIRSKYNDKMCVGNTKSDARFDALVSDEKQDSIVGVECKLGASEDKNQLKREAKNLGVRLKDIRSLYWEDIYTAMHKKVKISKIQTDIDMFLLDEFVEYLGGVGMTDFEGISYKTRQEYDIGIAKDDLKRMMYMLDKEKDLNLKGYRSKMDEAWNYRLDEEVFNKVGNKCGMNITHYSFYMRPDFLGMDLVIGGEKNGLIKAFKNSGDNTFINFLKGLSKKSNLWYFEANDYRLLNWKKGQIKGKKFQPMGLLINLEYYFRKYPDDKLNLIKMIIKYSSQAKGLRIFKRYEIEDEKYSSIFFSRSYLKEISDSIKMLKPIAKHLRDTYGKNSKLKQ